MKLSIRHLLFGIAVFGAVVVAYTDRNQVDFGEHKRFDDQLNRLGEVDAALNQDVLKARFRMITNYDGIPGKLEELKRTVIALHDMPSFIPVARQEPIRHKLDELTQTFGAKEQLIEDFKSENAVVNNSLRYLPLASKRLIAALDSGTEGSLLKSRMESLIQQLLIYCLDSGENEERAIRQSLGELASWHTQHPDHAQAASVARVSAHVTSIVGRTPKVELLTQEIVALPTSQDAEQLGRLYDAELSKALHRADVIRWVFQGACLLSLLSVAYTIYELNSGNRLLEQRVKERTAALRETNQRFELVTTATTNVIWDWDLLQGTILWNENFQTVFGYSADTVGTGAESWTQRIHPDDVALTMRSIRAFIAGSDRLWSHEYRFRRHDGSYAFVFAHHDRHWGSVECDGLTFQVE